MNVAIIGAGIFGRTIAKELQHQGHRTFLIDRGEKLQGSRPSGFVLKPSWISSLNKEELKTALALLDRAFGLHKVQLKIAGLLTTDCWRLDRRSVFVDSDVIMADVRKIMPHGEKFMLFTEHHAASFEGVMQLDAVVVAAGIWSPELVDIADYGLHGKNGVSFLVPNNSEESSVTPWAPFKQVVRVREDDGRSWVGDGTAILTHNWTDARVTQTMERIHKHHPDLDIKPEHAIVGIRPMAKLKGTRPCVLKAITPRYWVATGGGKNGTIAAAWAAGIIAEGLK